jgi:hypothetical protein
VHVIASKDYRSPIFANLNGTYESHSKHEMDRMNSRTKQCSIIAGELYKSGIVAPMLKCICREQGIELLSEMHAGMCGAHRGPHYDTPGVNFKLSNGLSLIQASQRMIMSFSLTLFKVTTKVELNFFKWDLT